MFCENQICSIDLFDNRIFKAEYERWFTALRYFAMHYLQDEEAAKICLYQGNCLILMRDQKRTGKRMKGYSVKVFSLINIAINTIKRHKNNANHYIRERLEKLLLLLMLYLSEIKGCLKL